LGEKANSPISCLISTGNTKEERLELRRCLACNFPGIRTLGKKSLSEAAILKGRFGLIIQIENGLWMIEHGPEVRIPDQISLTGNGYVDLIETISQIETVNRQ
jgi:hypothetical protein